MRAGRSVLASAVASWVLQSALQLVASGSPAIVSQEVPANGLIFDSISCGNGTAGHVLMLHGFPEWSDMYIPLMQQLAERGFRSVAYNQRGYSPKASPTDEAAYNYQNLRQDVFAVAEAVGFNKFHLVGHDHGGVLGWYAAGSPMGLQRVLTYSSLSIPHPDAFSAGLFGEGSDRYQQAASNYITNFILPNSASLADGYLYKIMGKSSRFDSPAAFQKALYWYNGVIAAGVMAVPPRMSAEQLEALGFPQMAAMRRVFGGIPDSGKPQTEPVGSIGVPALYVIGNKDAAILGTRPFALETEHYCAAGYDYLEVDAGHNLLDLEACPACQRVYDAVVAMVSRPQRANIIMA